MNKLGTNKGTSTAKPYRQFIINCYGENDRRKYYSIQPFGQDANAPEELKGLTVDSGNKDDNFIIGFLNALKLDSLAKGEQILFSTSADGKTLKSYIKLLNTKVIEFNGNADFIAGFTKLKEGFDQLKSDFNSFVTTKFNLHMHATAGTGAPSPPSVTGTSSTATIDPCKKANLKTE